MTRSKLMTFAHTEARVALRFAPFLTYRQALANALRGAHAVANGFGG